LALTSPSTPLGLPQFRLAPGYPRVARSFHYSRLIGLPIFEGNTSNTVKPSDPLFQLERLFLSPFVVPYGPFRDISRVLFSRPFFPSETGLLTSCVILSPDNVLALDRNSSPPFVPQVVVYFQSLLCRLSVARPSENPTNQPFHIPRTRLRFVRNRSLAKVSAGSFLLFALSKSDYPATFFFFSLLTFLTHPRPCFTLLGVPGRTPRPSIPARGCHPLPRLPFDS